MKKGKKGSEREEEIVKEVAIREKTKRERTTGENQKRERRTKKFWYPFLSL